MPGFNRDETIAARQEKSAPVRKSGSGSPPTNANQDAEDSTANAQKQFMAAIDSVSDGFALFDADDRMVFCNRRFKELNPDLAPKIVPGISFEEMLRENIATSRILDAIGDEESFIRKRMEQHRNPSGPLVQQRRDGRWLELREERTPEGATFLVNTDITERKRVEANLRESEARFRFAFENAPVGMALITPEGKRFKVNKALADFLGYSVAELVDTEMKSTAGDLDDLAESLRLRQRVLDGEIETYRNVRRYRHKQGHIVWGEVSGSLFRNQDGEPEHFIAQTIDITERKEAEAALLESEARLSKAAEMAKIGYWVWDEVEEKTIYCTEELAKTYGVASGAELAAAFSSRAAVLEWIHPEDRERFAEVDRTATELKRGYDTEYRIVDAAGEVRHLHVIGEPILDERGDLIRSYGIAQDITEQKRAEEQLRQAQRMEAVGQLTAGVAHDFNNMLAVISGNTELLEDELGKDNPQLAAVFRATGRAADLTQRLLAFSRRQMLRPEIVNANKLIANTTGLLHRTLEEHIDIETVTAAGLWNCEVDPAQLENALVNLALNARDAMPDGGKLTIETANARLDDDYAAAQAEVTPGHYVMLAVTDTGTGMPPGVREHAFEPFFTTKEIGAGSGLGLSMVYGFVKQSGGHVTIYSEPGEGTTIKLYLPRSTESEAVERTPVTVEVPIARGETVLVVEDDPEVRNLTVALLCNLGYRIVEAATGAAALEQLGLTTGVNLLLTDVVLAGGMNGRELAAEVERRAPGIKILFMSGYTENAIAHHGRLEAGAELLQKPFRRTDLARAVRRILDSRSGSLSG